MSNASQNKPLGADEVVSEEFEDDALYDGKKDGRSAGEGDGASGAPEGEERGIETSNDLDTP